MAINPKVDVLDEDDQTTEPEVVFVDADEFYEDETTITVDVELPGGKSWPITVTYVSGRITPKTVSAMRKVEAMSRKGVSDRLRKGGRRSSMGFSTLDDSNTYVIAMLMDLCVSWNISERETGEMVPFTEEGLGRVNSSILMQVMQGIMDPKDE